MRIERESERHASMAPEGAFTGAVTIGGNVRRPAPSRLVSAIVQFPPGSRTPWKVNPFGQMLFVTSGAGRVQSEGCAVVEVRAGNIV